MIEIKQEQYADGKYYFYRADRGLHDRLENPKALIVHSKNRYFDGSMEQFITNLVLCGGVVYDFKHVVDEPKDIVTGCAFILLRATEQEMLNMEKQLNCARTKSGSPWVLIVKDDFDKKQLQDLIEGL